jgi:glutamine synthetase
VLPPLPMHGGDRNRTSPFAFTGNKFEFRALGSSGSRALPNTVLNTIVAEAIDDLTDKLEARADGDIAAAVSEVVRESYAANKQILFSGDNYEESWHDEASKRGLKNLRTTPDALPELLSSPTVVAFEKYKVLSQRELESRYEVMLEQYVINANIEAETTADIGRTMILPAALRYLELIDEAEIEPLARPIKALVGELVVALDELDHANSYPAGVEGMKLAEHARDKQIAGMENVREVVDKLEKQVADELWPLPKYSEILFIK